MGSLVIKADVNKTIKEGDRRLWFCGITCHFANGCLILNGNISDLWFVWIDTAMVMVQQQNHFVLILVLMFI